MPAPTRFKPGQSVNPSGRPSRTLTYSFTPISQYLRCARSYRYRYRYLDGWREKETRAAMVFGRGFETALGACFRSEDPSAVFAPRVWST